MLRVDVIGLEVRGKFLVGDLFYQPYHMSVENYYFRADDVVVDDDEDCYMDITEDKLFELAYDIN